MNVADQSLMKSKLKRERVKFSPVMGEDFIMARGKPNVDEVEKSVDEKLALPLMP